MAFIETSVRPGRSNSRRKGSKDAQMTRFRAPPMLDYLIDFPGQSLYGSDPQPIEWESVGWIEFRTKESHCLISGLNSCNVKRVSNLRPELNRIEFPD
jgi:hypothetical protein